MQRIYIQCAPKWFCIRPPSRGRCEHCQLQFGPFQEILFQRWVEVISKTCFSPIASQLRAVLQEMHLGSARVMGVAEQTKPTISSHRLPSGQLVHHRSDTPKPSAREQQVHEEQMLTAAPPRGYESSPAGPTLARKQPTAMMDDSKGIMEQSRAYRALSTFLLTRREGRSTAYAFALRIEKGFT